MEMMSLVPNIIRGNKINRMIYARSTDDRMYRFIHGESSARTTGEHGSQVLHIPWFEARKHMDVKRPRFPSDIF